MNETTRSMLLELVELLEQLPPERFDYAVWVGEGWRGDPDLSCGTTACAAGWATTLPSFRARGLRMVRLWKGEKEGTYAGAVRAGVPSDSVSSMAHVLDIPQRHAAWLFCPDVPGWQADFEWDAPGPDAGPAEVAAHIRRYLAVA